MHDPNITKHEMNETQYTEDEAKLEWQIQAQVEVEVGKNKRKRRKQYINK